MESKQKYTEDKNSEMNELKDIVESMFRVNIQTKSRIRDVVDARMVFSRILRERGHQWTTIGKYLSKDHSTIIHLYQQSSDILPIDSRLMGMYLKCKDKFMEDKEDYNPIKRNEIKNELDFLKNQLNDLILRNEKLERYADKYRRFESIINLIESRTKKGSEKIIEKKINEMFNGF
jgi:hypothetical protein